MLILKYPSHEGAAPPFAPTDLANLLVWYKADALSLANGNPVSSWPDSSGNERDLAQAASTKRPSYQATSGPNSQPMVRFDGVDDFMNVAYSYTVPVTLFVVLFNTTFTSNERIIEANASTTLPLLQSGTAPRLLARGTGTSGGATTTELPMTTWGLVTVTWSGSPYTVTLQVNNGTIGSSSYSLGTPAGLSVAATGTGAGVAHVSIAEIIQYNQLLSDADKGQVKNYINGKYALW